MAVKNIDLDRNEGGIRSIRELIRLKKTQEAEAILLDSLKKNPKSVTAYRLLSEVEWQLGHLPRAMLALEEWLKIEPNNSEIWSRLGAAHQAMDQAVKAMEAYKTATELAPGKASAWAGYALAALSAQKWQHSESAAQHLLEFFPRYGVSHVICGHIHKMRGRVPEAIAAYEQALELEPDLAAALYNLVDIKIPDPDDALTRRIQNLCGQKDISNADRVNLLYSLGRIYEKARQYAVAFANYMSANEISLEEMRGRGITYDPKLVEERTHDTIRCYVATSFRHPVEPLPIDLKLIFIVGLPRSGTTLIEQILAAHPRVTSGGELSVARDTYHHYVRRRAEKGMDGIVDTTKMDEAELLLEAREIYLDNLFACDMEGEYISDKLPANFAILGFIRLLFPNALIIHSRRHPLATCWSLYSSNFGLHDPYYNSLKHLGHYCRMYQRLMAHWSEVLDPPMIEIGYEDLVSNPEQEIYRLLENVGLPRDEACLRFYQHPRPVLTASYNQVRQPAYTSSIDRWRHFAAYLGDLAQALQA